jgi:hypothetical protein
MPHVFMIKFENTVRFLYGLINMYVNMKMSFMQGQIGKDALSMDRLCGLVVRVPGYRSRGPGFDSRRYQIF